MLCQEDDPFPPRVRRGEPLGAKTSPEVEDFWLAR